MEKGDQKEPQRCIYLSICRLIIAIIVIRVHPNKDHLVQ